MSKSFLSRWSRRKSTNSIEDVAQPSPDATNTKLVVKLEESANAEAAQTPTMDDVEKIDKTAADFSAFMQGDVDPTVQRAAMKKLFSDPHFNVMDGLDIYIDDIQNRIPFHRKYSPNWFNQKCWDYSKIKMKLPKWAILRKLGRLINNCLWGRLLKVKKI